MQLEKQDLLASATVKASHGSIVFGKAKIYLYHLPMWVNPHAWHLIFEVELDQQGLKLYQADQAAGGTLQSINPEPFALAQLKPGFAIHGVLFHGHFEQGGTALPSNSNPATVTVKVKRIITVKALDPQRSPWSSSVYRVFGSGTEYFAAHLPSGQPDFDQLLAIEPGEGCSIPKQANDGMTVRLNSSLGNIKSRPKVGNKLIVITSQSQEYCFKISSEAYFSASDLGN